MTVQVVYEAPHWPLSYLHSSFSLQSSELRLLHVFLVDLSPLFNSLHCRFSSDAIHKGVIVSQ